MIYDERIKLIDIVTRTKRYRDELGEFVEGFCSQSNEYIEILDESYNHLVNLGVINQIKIWINRRKAWSRNKNY